MQNEPTSTPLEEKTAKGVQNYWMHRWSQQQQEEQKIRHQDPWLGVSHKVWLLCALLLIIAGFSAGSMRFGLFLLALACGCALMATVHATPIWTDGMELGTVEKKKAFSNYQRTLGQLHENIRLPGGKAQGAWKLWVMGLCRALLFWGCVVLVFASIGWQ